MRVLGIKIYVKNFQPAIVELEYKNYSRHIQMVGKNIVEN